MLKNLIQVLAGLLSALMSMFCWKRLTGGWSPMVATVIMAGAAANLRYPDTFYFGIGLMLGGAAPFAAVYAKDAYVWAIEKWSGYSKDDEGRVIVDAIGVVVG